MLSILSTDFEDCDNEFEKLENKFNKIKRSNHKEKSEITCDIEEIRYEFLRYLTGLKQFDIDVKLYADKYEIELKQFQSVIAKFKIKFTEVKNNFNLLENVKRIPKYEEKKLSSTEDIPSNIKYESFSSQEDNTNSRRIVNQYILRSRQTEEPFILSVMKGWCRNQCNGCKTSISLESFFLSHKEEYPSGSKKFKPHSYHVNEECFIERGFQKSYLKHAKVINCIFSNEIIKDILTKIGFQLKNIDFSELKLDDTNIDSDSDVPDDVSVSSKNSSVCSDIISYFSLHNNQKTGIKCKGCLLNIDNDFYITYDNNNPPLEFHITKKCLILGKLFPNKLINAKCKVYNLLEKNKYSLQDLLQCGFNYYKLIGYRPPHPLNKSIKTPDSYTDKKDKDQPPNVEHKSIFNKEPFYCERLSYSNKCYGCENQIGKGMLTFRHKEEENRKGLDHCPLVSKFYHVNKMCLISRGFNVKYLLLAKCKVDLSSDDVVRYVEKKIVECGFSVENLSFTLKENPVSVESRTSVSDSNDKYKLYVEYCPNSLRECHGCGFMLLINQLCFIYSQSNKQSDNSIWFHVQEECFNGHFTPERIKIIPCIVNKKIHGDSFKEIYKCGIKSFKIGNEDLSPTLQTCIYKNSKQKITRHLISFVVCLADSQMFSCSACNQAFELDTYFLRLRDVKTKNTMIHLKKNCILALVHPSQVEQSKLSFQVNVTQDLLDKLKNVGFKSLPRN